MRKDGVRFGKLGGGAETRMEKGKETATQISITFEIL